MEKFDGIDFNKENIHSNLFLQVDAMLIKFQNRLFEKNEEIFSEIVPCYRIKKKNSKEKNVDYVGRVENCLKKTNAEEKYFNYKQFARNMDKIKSNYEMSKLNCFNLVSEREIDVCYNDATKGFASNLIDILEKISK